MAYSSVIRKVALGLAQRELAKRINVVGNKADIVFTRLDFSLSTIKSLVPSVFSALSKIGIQYVVIPVVPSDLPTIEQSFEHESFDAMEGPITVMGERGLRRVTLENYLLPDEPSKYPFCRPYGSSAEAVVAFLKKAQADHVPLRITIAFHDGRTYLNMPCLVESISTSRDSVDDMRMSVSLIEYIELDRAVKVKYLGGVTK